MTKYYPSAEDLGKLLIRKFESLPKTGKPTTKEWTVLAGVVEYNSKTLNSQVVALGAGTKCIAASKLQEDGFILNDSHAEVLARRALLRYCYAELRKAAESRVGSNLFKWNKCDSVFDVDEHVTFHFVCTHTPCGDACIIETPSCTVNVDEPAKKQFKNEQGNAVPTSEIIYTGARLVGDHSDSMLQTLREVRTKPGRGERTLSVSCSDKLAKWNKLGWQGGLLYAFIKRPLYFQTLNFSCRSNEAALKRAIVTRWQNDSCPSSQFSSQNPEIRTFQLDQTYEYLEEINKQPSPNGLAWCNIDETQKPYEISVNGKRQGITAKLINTVHAALKISKFWLLNDFVTIIKIQPQLMRRFNFKMEDNLTKTKYITWKQMDQDYQNAWQEMKADVRWTEKPKGLVMFTLEALETMAIKSGSQKRSNMTSISLSN